MGREPHFLDRVTADRFPTRLIALAVQSDDEPDLNRPTLVKETLARWAAVGYNKDHRGAVREWSGGGLDRISWWDTVRWACKRPGVTWIVTYGCSRAAGLLGLWEAIETGQAQLDGRDSHDREGTVDRCILPEVRGTEPFAENGTVGGSGDCLPKVQDTHEHQSCRTGIQNGRRMRNRGFACLEDPPTILAFRLPGSPGRIQWIDARNYGIDRTAGTETAEAGASSLYRFLTAMVDTLRRCEWGGLMTTTASQSLHTLRRRYLSYAMFCHDDATALALERAAYVGGRCEARRIGTIPGPVYQYDVRSMYPYVCSVLSLPAILARTGTGTLPAVLASNGNQLDCIAEVEIQTEEAAYPALHKGQTVYPIGRFWTTLAGPELADAIAHSRVRSFGRWAQYHLSPCLRDYANAVYGERMAAKASGNVELEQWLKALSVCIVGKLGQRGWRWEFDPSIVPVAPWCQWPKIDPVVGPVRQRSLGWQCQREVKEDWAWNAIPSIAAWVCSSARVRLLDCIRTAGWDEVYYYDTDSVIVSAVGSGRINQQYGGTAGEFGGWRLCQCDNYCQVWGQKYYKIGGRTVHAGLPRGECRREGATDFYWYRDWIRRAVAAGRRPEPARRLIRYTQPGTYRAGLVGDGGIVHPFRLGDDQ